MRKAIFLGIRDIWAVWAIDKYDFKNASLIPDQPVPIGTPIAVLKRKVSWPTSLKWEVVNCDYDTGFIGEVLADCELSFDTEKELKMEDWL